jgi:hypothetical protein
LLALRRRGGAEGAAVSAYIVTSPTRKKICDNCAVEWRGLLVPRPGGEAGGAAASSASNGHTRHAHQHQESAPQAGGDAAQTWFCLFCSTENNVLDLPDDVDQLCSFCGCSFRLQLMTSVGRWAALNFISDEDHVAGRGPHGRPKP